jgi:DNA-binding MarR family transcriptional regulator
MADTENAGANAEANVTGEGEAADMKSVYLETLQLIERLHRQFLDVIKTELDRLGIKDCNNVQALILYNIGDNEMTVGELTTRGYYLGSNVTYNLKKLVENGFVDQERSAHDRRSVRIRLSEKGGQLHAALDGLYRQHVQALAEGVIDAEALEAIKASLSTMERFWASQLRFGAR